MLTVLDSNKVGFDGVLEMRQRALVIREKMLGKNHADTITSDRFRNLWANYDGALEMYQICPKNSQKEADRKSL